MNARDLSASERTHPDRRAVRVLSRGTATAGFLLRDEGLDADGSTVSVVGCKSGIVGRKKGDTVVVILSDGQVVPAMITHIHAAHDRFRAAVTAARLPAALSRDKLSLEPPRRPTTAGVSLIDPISRDSIREQR